MVVRGSAWLAASWTSRSGTPASSAAVMKAWRSVWGPTSFGDPSLSGDPTHDAPGGVSVESFTRAVLEDRALETFADREVEGPGDPRRERHRDDVPAFAGHR
jgi:hypothetical protein